PRSTAPPTTATDIPPKARRSPAAPAPQAAISPPDAATTPSPSPPASPPIRCAAVAHTYQSRGDRWHDRCRRIRLDEGAAPPIVDTARAAVGERAIRPR